MGSPLPLSSVLYRAAYAYRKRVPDIPLLIEYPLPRNHLPVTDKPTAPVFPGPAGKMLEETRRQFRSGLVCQEIKFYKFKFGWYFRSDPPIDPQHFYCFDFPASCVRHFPNNRYSAQPWKRLSHSCSSSFAVFRPTDPIVA